MKKINKTIFQCLSLTATVGTLVTSLAIPASAQTYYNGISRGLNYVSYVETDVYWDVDWRNNITDSRAYQYTRGYNVNEGGVYKVEYGPLEHVWDAITEATLGLSYKGVGIGWVNSIRDRIHVANWDNMWVEWDI